MIVDIRRDLRASPLSERELSGQPSIKLTAQLYAEWSYIPVIGYVNSTPQHARDILAAAHAGASDIILGDFDDLEMAVGKILGISTTKYVVSRVDRIMAGIVPAHLREFFLFCMANTHYPLSVDGVAGRLQRSRKTLSNWLVAAHLLPPSRIVMWARVLVAARMLEDLTQSSEKIARELHFMNGASLRAMLRRYLGCSPDVLRQRGGFEYALARFVEALQATQGARY
jgi:AraC-like DNA-binding protein